MAATQAETYQLAGLDTRDRGFTRSVDFECAGAGYRAVFRYETERVLTGEHETREAALIALVRVLQGRGYRQLKSRLIVRHGVYLGSLEPWIEYPDPVQRAEDRGRFDVYGCLRRWFTASFGNRR